MSETQKKLKLIKLYRYAGSELLKQGICITQVVLFLKVKNMQNTLFFEKDGEIKQGMSIALSNYAPPNCTNAKLLFRQMYPKKHL